MANMKIKKGDTVVILTGKENGKTGEVLECFPKENKVTVKNLNIIVKHKKPRSAQDKGGIIKLEGKIEVSNVMVICPSCNKATRVSMEMTSDKKVRKCKKCGAVLDAKKVAKSSKKEDKKESKVASKAASKVASKEKAAEVKATKAKKAASTTSKKEAKSSKTQKSTVKSEA